MKVVENLFNKAYGEKLTFENTYVVGTQLNYLNEAIGMCTYNICHWK